MINNFTIEEVREFWDNVAPIYESSNKTVGYVHYQRYEKAMLYTDLEPGQKVLNIWSRMGSLIPYIRKVSDLELYNREVSPEFIKEAIKKFPNENFDKTELKNLSEFPDNYFDRIISLETLEHTPEPTIFLKELKRILKSDGMLVMSLPPRGFEIPTMIWDSLFKNHGEGPHRFLWPKDVKKMLKEASLTLVKHAPFIILPLGNDRLERLSEKILTFIFGKTPLANFGVRHFYICKNKSYINQNESH